MDIGELLRDVGTLVLAALCGGLIGFERERHDRPAGLRTHILVCLGAALITLVSRSMGGTQYDPGRIAAQIVSGIGFLGAGTILRQGSVIRGLTTAASLWVVAGIGMAMAAGPEIQLLGAAATLLVFLTLSVVSRLEVPVSERRGFRTVGITIEGDRAAVAQLLLNLVGQEVEVRRLTVEPGEVVGHLRVWITMRTPQGFPVGKIGSWLSRQPGVVGFEWA